MLDPILISAVIVLVVAATVIDLKTKEIPNWINFSLILIGFCIFLIKSISQNSINPILKSITYFLIFSAIGLIMYYTKQWGGGDSKLLMGIGATLPTYPAFLLEFFNPKLTISLPTTFLINLIIFGSFYGLGYTLYLILKHKKIIFQEFTHSIKKYKKLNNFSIFSLALGFLLVIVSANSFGKIVAIIFLIFPIILIYLLFLTKSTEKLTMHKKIKTSKLVEGDWITEEVLINNKVIYSPNQIGVNKKQIKLIQKDKKEIKIKDGIAFAPPFLMSLIISIIYGNILLLII